MTFFFAALDAKFGLLRAEHLDLGLLSIFQAGWANSRGHSSLKRAESRPVSMLTRLAPFS